MPPFAPVSSGDERIAVSLLIRPGLVSGPSGTHDRELGLSAAAGQLQVSGQTSENPAPGSHPLGLAISTLARLAQLASNRAAPDGDPLASTGIPALVALEIARPGRATEG